MHAANAAEPNHSIQDLLDHPDLSRGRKIELAQGALLLASVLLQDAVREAKPKSKLMLIPDPEEGHAPSYGLRPGWYSHQEFVDLLRFHAHQPEVIRYLADMLEE